MKMRLGRDPVYDRRAVEVVLAVLNGQAQLAVDGTHRYSLSSAVEFGHFLAERGIAWFEEPFPPEDIDAYASLRAKVEVPIAAGENEFGLQGFRSCFAPKQLTSPSPTFPGQAESPKASGSQGSQPNTECKS